MRVYICGLVVGGVLAPISLFAQQGQSAPAVEERLFVDEQRVLTPGFPVGNIAIADPAVADFTVMPGRREVLVVGTGVGETTLTLWDQQDVKRREVTIGVSTEIADNLEGELRELLWEFPSVDVRTLAGTLVLSGTVSAQDELDAVESIAEAAGIRTLVRLRASGGSDSPSRGDAGVDPQRAPSEMTVEYELELLETDEQFRSGSYATGIEPSGRQMFSGGVSTPLGEEGHVLIVGPEVFPEAAEHAVPQFGIRLTLRSEPPDDQGAFTTHVLIENNLPYDSDLYDPQVWRRARWDLGAVTGEPIGIAGNDLMAAAATPDRSSALRTIGSTISRVGMLPGVSSLPGSQYTGAGMVTTYYNEDTKTHLMLIVRPRLLRMEPQ